MAETVNWLSSSNSTLADDWNYYNWCKDYPTGPVFWSALSVICFLLGFPASLWVLHELIQKQRQKSSSDFFMLSLSVIDLSFTIQTLFSVCNFMLWHNKDLEVVIDFIYSLSVTGRPLFMACNCWDCYVAVVYPITYKTSKKFIVVKKALTITIYFITVVFGLVLSIITSTSTTPFVSISLIIALPVITFCDISILRALRKPDPTGKITIHPQKKQALLTISSSFIMTFLAYLPPVIIFSFGWLFPLKQIELYCCVDFPGFSFHLIGCFVMPVHYLVTVGKLNTFKNWWKKKSCM